MKARAFAVTVAALPLLGVPTAAVAKTCADTLTPTSGATAFLNCLSEMQRSIEALERESGFPPGAVVAFDLLQGCPGDGWTNVTKLENGAKRFAGRMLLVAADAESRDGTLSTSDRKFDDQEGEEAHTLFPEEIPPHAHQGETELVKKMSVTVAREAGRGFNSGVITGSNQNDGDLERKSNVSIPGDHTHLVRLEAEARDTKPHNNMPPFIALHFCRKN